MTHNEQRTHWVKEGFIGLGVGILYGTTSVVVGHPFDTIKTKMQAQAGFERTTMFQSFSKTLQRDGIRGLYRGAMPPLMGSGIFRSVQFAVFEAAYTYMDGTFASEMALPVLQGLQLRVIIGGLLAATSRSIIETPLEYAKVRRQTGQAWDVRHLYQGFGVTWIRTAGLMTSYFIAVDYLRRTQPDLFKTTLGPFLISGVAATGAWWLVWPFENMKSQVQAGYGGKMSLWRRMKLTVKEKGGISGLYRGLGPGSIRSFLANGSSMVVMQWAQRKVSEFGFRD